MVGPGKLITLDSAGMEWKCFAEKKKHHHNGSGVPTATISLEPGPLVAPLHPHSLIFTNF